jgi:hypothetical protein
MIPAVISTIPEGATLEDKMDIVLQLLIRQSRQLTIYEEKISALENANKKLSSTVNSLNREVYTLKNTINIRELQARSNSVRLFGLSMADDETGATDGGKALAARIYDKILKHILVEAKAKGPVPSCSSVVEECYRVGKAGPDRSKPPPVVIKFCNKAIRLTVMRNKKTGMPTPSASDAAAGIKCYVIVEDLTKDSHRLLKSLAADERISKVWSRDGSIRFILAGDKTNKVVKVKSVYDQLEEIIFGAT